MAETATPTSTSRMGATSPAVFAKEYTSTMERMAPANAPTGTLSILPEGSTTPTSMASTAPVEAPLEMPSTYGSARGFLVNACILMPERVRLPPTTMPSSARGMRMRHTMFRVLSLMSSMLNRPNRL